MDSYDKETRAYTLDGNHTLETAELIEFRVWYTVYKNSNPFFRFEWEQHLQVLDEDSRCFWIKRGLARIGGVLMAPNLITGLFLIPPCSDTGQVVGMLVRLLKRWSDGPEGIRAFGVLPNQIEHYQRLGFRVAESTRCMIRPTEPFKAVFDDGLDLVPPGPEHAAAIAEFLYEAGRGDALKAPAALASEKRENADFFFANYASLELHMEASVLVVDRETGKMMGVCLISSWEDQPLVYELAVDPAYRGKGLAENMLKRAIGILNQRYALLRLFVTVGNGAQALYHKMGFLAGPESAELFLPIA